MSATPARRGPEPVGSRLRRLLVLLPWLMERGSATVGEAAERFGVSQQQVIDDVELASLCGLPPYLDEMIDVFIDDGVIHAGVPRLFTRPLRLSTREAFSLVAAGRAALELPGADAGGPLARALAKVERALGARPVLRVDVPAPPHLEQVRAAAERGERLAITYWSATSGTSSERELDPLAVVAEGGHWYLRAADRRSGQDRWFRVDRIEVVRPTGEAFGRREAAVAPPDWVEELSGATLVTLRVPRAGGWFVDRYPVAGVREDGPDHLVVDLPVTSVRWLERLLLRLGAEARVTAPPELVGVGRAAASRVLARYRAGET